MKPIHIFNGPNLNLLGEREPHIYGTTTLDEIRQRCEAVAQQYKVQVVFEQTNHEGQLIEWLHVARKHASGIIINPAAWSFTSIAVLDALKASELPIYEVHLSNIHRREPIYQKSMVSSIAKGVVCGFGPMGYEASIHALYAHLQAEAVGA